ncbi:uncharacterized protein F4817DRAFT_344101 [Daldinia loculata]|uniref:uncharacterized protein n=1 Tax=Daldinia loculata TaxID=103429 RepID=UPI0020C44C0D|nr:uncharacterized protein F4817DRAFT_344101 [Daldinia loculata]KAI1645224.1 hypothetical protein F4817DRAFT_344101 [Daldinia loculata]
MSNLGPLTTAYQAQGTGCHSIHMGSSLGGIWLQHGTISGCFPSNYRSYDGYYYSPGVCPEGYTYACTGAAMSGTSSASVATCCPSGYVCSREDHSDPNACQSTMVSPNSYMVDLLSYSGGSPTKIGTTTASFGSGAIVFAKGLAVWRASNDAEWFASATLSSTTDENTIRTPLSVPTTTVNVQNATPTPAAETNNLSVGAKVGIGLGVSLGVLFFISTTLAAYIIGRRKGRRINKFAGSNTSGSEGKYGSGVPEEQFNEQRSMVEMSADREPAELMSLQR